MCHTAWTGRVPFTTDASGQGHNTRGKFGEKIKDYEQDDTDKQDA